MNNLNELKNVLYNQINNYLINIRGFDKQDDSRYTKMYTKTEPGPTIIINGIAAPSTPTVHRLIFVCELHGQGSIIHHDERPDDIFELIHFSWSLDGNVIGSHTDGFYYDEYPKFVRLTSEVFAQYGI